MIKIKKQHATKEIFELNLEDLYTQIKEGKISSANEIIDKEVKGYLDFDPKSNNEEDSFNFLNQIEEILDKIPELNRKYNRSEILTYSIYHNLRPISLTEFKHSFHVIIDSLFFDCGSTCKKYMLELFKEFSKENHLEFDLNVYKKSNN